MNEQIENKAEQPADDKIINACVTLIETLRSMDLWDFYLLDGRRCVIKESQEGGYKVKITGEEKEALYTFVGTEGDYVAARKDGSEPNQKEMEELNHTFAEIMVE